MESGKKESDRETGENVEREEKRQKKSKGEDKFVLFDGREYDEVNNGKVEDYPLERSNQTKTNAVLLKFFFQVHTRKQHEIESHACTMHRVLSTAWSAKQQQQQIA
uniref:Uncharacterized protein n=1 Tax=Glossina austeni TaxID=7395 RepID=A0A1A9VGI3_GLOAU